MRSRSPIPGLWPFNPQRAPFFYGWAIVAAGTLGILASIPGQTMGVSVFTDHLIGATGLTRVELSNAYMIGTLLSGLLLPKVGTILDRVGTRVLAIGACVLLGMTLVYLQAVGAIADWINGKEASGGAITWVVLTAGFLALRLSGQGTLTLASRNMIAKWFNRRRGLAVAVSGLFVSFGFAAAPTLLAKLIELLGWRGAWLAIAATVGLGVTTIALVFFRDNPEDCGMVMDGGDKNAPNSAYDVQPFSRSEALRTLAFWSITLSLAFHGMIVTGITFHIVDLGRAADIAEKTIVTYFVPMAVVSTSTGYVVGILADRVAIRYLVMFMMASEAVGVWGAAHLAPGPMSWVMIGGFGLAGGCWGPLSGVALPKYFGRLHLGSISGAQMMAAVLGSAVGPTLFALSRDQFGSYQPGLLVCLALPVLAFVMTMRVRNPQRQNEMGVSP